MQRTSILDGLSLPVLQARLTALQLALLDLESGAKVATASYTQGDGARTVSYTQADRVSLRQTILSVQAQIDRLTGACVNRRAPLRPFF
jgi:hypothetical protein